MERLNHFTLSSRTKATIAQTVGVEFDILQNLDPDAVQTMVTKKLGHAVRYNHTPRIDACPLGRTIQEVDAQLNRITD